MTNALRQAVGNMEMRIVNNKEAEIMNFTLDFVYTEFGFMEVGVGRTLLQAQEQRETLYIHLSFLYLIPVRPRERSCTGT